MRLAPLLSGLCAVCVVATSHAAEITHLNKAGIMPPGVPFSEAVRVDDTLYISGQLGNLPGVLELVPGGMAAEARQTLENVRGVLEANGLGMSDMVRCQVMLADISEWGEFNEVYMTFFEAPYPARSAFAAAGLALDARVELECIAAYPD